MTTRTTRESIESFRRRQRRSRGGWMRRVLRRLRRAVRGSTMAIHLPQPVYPAARPELRKTLLIPVGPGFDQTRPGSGILIRTGMAGGWAEACGPAKLVPLRQLAAELDEHDRPAVYLSLHELAELTPAGARRLRDVDCLVWVHVHPSQFESLLRSYPLLNRFEMQRQLQAYENLVLAEPKFIWSPVGSAGEALYRGWREDGFRFERLLLAADPQRYRPQPAAEKFGEVRMAYVGGYWPEKAQAFEIYLRPWEEVLVIYGNNSWPYRHYRGQIALSDEPRLYSMAGLVPLVTTPASREMAELTERYFKVPACRAFCIADTNPAVRDAFSEEELIQAESPEHFHDLVRDFLAGRIDTEMWRERSWRAVQERHLYRHRAIRVRDLLETTRGEGG